MIILDKKVFEALKVPSREGLQIALQQAIQLEHATIPPYLYAQYSLKLGTNQQIRSLLVSIVLEEMLHMALACNILNAIGGTPSIDDPGMIPVYPGPLPGGVEEGLQVPLAPFSLSLVKNVFMGIEQPEEPINFRVAATEAEPPTTIGLFYRTIRDHIQQLGSSIFVDPGDQRGRQVTTPDFPNLIKVTSVDTAVQAIETIVEQGEGTSTSPDDQLKEVAHYYRFNEIVLGKTLQPNPNATPQTPPDQRFFYGDPPIVFTPDGVWPLPTNPKMSDYPENSPARQGCHEFNQAYTDLLHMLHTTFNGQPDTLTTAVDQMDQLNIKATRLVKIDIGNGKNAGPSFEYIPSH